MGLLLFVIIADNETPKFRLKENFFEIPTTYTIGNARYVDRVNTNSKMFASFKTHYFKDVVPQAPSQIIRYYIDKIHHMGFSRVCFILPSIKFTHYKKNVLNAIASYQSFCQRHYLRYMDITIVNSYSFANVPLMLADRITQMHYYGEYDSIKDPAYVQRMAKSTRTYVISKGKSIMGEDERIKAAYFYGTRMMPLNLTDKDDDVRLEVFIRHICKMIKRNASPFAVAFGSDCSYVKYTLGRINQLCGYYPTSLTQYGIPTANLFGAKGMCFIFADYI